MVLDVVAQVLSLLMVLNVVASAVGGLAIWVEVAVSPRMIRAADGVGRFCSGLVIADGARRCCFCSRWSRCMG